MVKCSLSADGLSLPEDGGKCCFLLPIKCGVMIIAIFILLIGAQAGIYLFEYFKNNSSINIGTIGWLVVVALLVIAGILAIRYLLNDNGRDMVRACELVLTAQLFTVAWFFIDRYLINKNSYHG